jgi:RNA polymerase-binding transcription factor DksA
MATKKNTKKAAPKKAAASKKPAAKKPAKKVAPKKKPVAKKPVKKVAPKKAVKKAPAKKVVAKKPIKKVVAKKPVKKAAPAKKKPVAKKVVKKAAPVKKVVAKAPVKAAVKPVKAEVKKVAPKAVAKVVEPAKPAMRMATKKEEKPVEAKTSKAPEPKKPELKMATSKPAKKESTHQGKKTPFSAPVDIKLFANMSKSFKIPVAKPNVIKQSTQATVDSRSRYSDTELQEFKEIILSKLGEARKDLEMLKGSLSHTDDHGTDDTSPSFKMMEDGSETLSREETAQLAGRQEKFIMALENALTRINNKTYGICRVTGKLISKDRLRLVPHTTLSIEAKNMQD